MFSFFFFLGEEMSIFSQNSVGLRVTFRIFFPNNLKYQTISLFVTFQNNLRN